MEIYDITEEERNMNMKLVQEYPFLLPRNRQNDEVSPDYEYEWTIFDSIPSGWRRSFGLQMIKELKEILVEFDYLYDYRIVCIRQQNGRLQWISNRIPKDIRDKYTAWISKYSNLAEHTCINCGKPGREINFPLQLPLCPDCYYRESNVRKPYADMIAGRKNSNVIPIVPQ